MFSFSFLISNNGSSAAINTGSSGRKLIFGLTLKATGVDDEDNFLTP
ncbi:unnamed protein product, partial [Rotaria magnacalcarata]